MIRENLQIENYSVTEESYHFNISYINNLLQNNLNSNYQLTSMFQRCKKLIFIHAFEAQNLKSKHTFSTSESNWKLARLIQINKRKKTILILPRYSQPENHLLKMSMLNLLLSNNHETHKKV